VNHICAEVIRANLSVDRLLRCDRETFAFERHQEGTGIAKTSKAFDLAVFGSPSSPVAGTNLILFAGPLQPFFDHFCCPSTAKAVTTALLRPVESAGFGLGVHAALVTFSVRTARWN
jgi:hypothetical protein